MEDFHRSCIDDLSLQLLLEQACYLIMELYCGDVVPDFLEAFDGCYLLLVLGPILWGVMLDELDVFLSLEDFTEDLYRPAIDNLCSHLLLLLVCFIMDLYDRSAVFSFSYAFDDYYSSLPPGFILWRITKYYFDIFLYLDHFAKDVHYPCIDYLSS